MTDIPADDKAFNALMEAIAALPPEQQRRLQIEIGYRLAVAAANIPPDLTPEEAADQEMQRRLFEAGLLSEIKPPRRGQDDRREPRLIRIKGEPLSETIIRERR
jgi:hypothetical protein